MSIILIHTLIQLVGLFICKGSALRLQCIQNHFSYNFLIVIVREGNTSLREMKPIPFLKLRDLLELGYVSVGYVIHALDALKELIAVLHNHQLVVANQTFFLELDCRTHTQIILYGTLV